MKAWITRWISSAIALVVVVSVVPGFHFGKDKVGSVLAAVVAISLVNAFIRPVIKFFTWPINMATFGLFGFGVNVLLFWLASTLGGGITISDWQSAVIGMVAMGLISGAINFVLKDRKSGASRR